MNRINRFALTALGLLILFVSGCSGERKSSFTPTENDYGIVTIVSGWDCPSVTAQLHYRSPNGKTVMVWPSLGSDPIFYHEHLALFTSRDALYAVEAPEAAADISGEILRLWAAQNHADLGTTLRKYRVSKLGRRDYQIEVSYWDYGGSNEESIIVVKPDWNQIAKAVQEVKDHGQMLKWVGVAYWEKTQSDTLDKPVTPQSGRDQR